MEKGSDMIVKRDSGSASAGQASGSATKNKSPALLKAEMVIFLNDVLMSEKRDYYMLNSKLEEVQRREAMYRDMLRNADMANATVYEKVRFLVTTNTTDDDSMKKVALKCCLEKLEKTIAELESLRDLYSLEKRETPSRKRKFPEVDSVWDLGKQLEVVLKSLELDVSMVDSKYADIKDGEDRDRAIVSAADFGEASLIERAKLLLLNDRRAVALGKMERLMNHKDDLKKLTEFFTIIATHVNSRSG